MKKLLIMLCCLLTVSVLLSSVYVFAGSDGSPDGYASWEDFYNGITGGGSSEQSEYIPELSEMKLAAKNKSVKLYYYEAENIFYFVDASGKIWSSVIRDDDISDASLTFSEKRTLFGINIADSENAVTTVEVLSGQKGDFSVDCDYGENSLTLRLNSETHGIAFDAVFGVDEYGAYCTIPSTSLTESGEYKLISVDVLPALAVADKNEDGYIVYADGCGALIDFSKHTVQNSETYSYQIWGDEEADLDTLAENEAYDIQTVTLPLFGMKHTSGGLLTAVCGGEETATLNIKHSGYYNAYFTLEYRTFYSADYNFTDSVFDQKQITKLGELRATDTDCTVRWFLLSGADSTYSDMAGVYRNYLLKNNLLKQSEAQDGIPISLDVFMSIEKSGIFGNSLNSLTTASEALSMLKKLENGGAGALDVRLMGWSSGGYTAMPTTVGGNKLNGLTDYCAENGISLYKEAEFIKAYSDAGGYNSQKDILRDCIKQPVTDKEEELLLLTPSDFLTEAVKKWSKKDKSGICFSSIGTLLLSGFKENDEMNRSNTLSAYKNALGGIQAAAVAVSGGNSYVLPYTDRLYDIPDTDSGYFQNTRTVPFYQMVVHGSVSYSSLAGNRSYDLQYQKLKWIETGSVPHYFVTEKDATEFADTDYDTVFSSRFSDYFDIMLEVGEEFNKEFGSFWYEPITEHKYLNENVVSVTYGEKNTVLINYGDEATVIDGVDIEANSYAVLRGDK